FEMIIPISIFLLISGSDDWTTYEGHCYHVSSVEHTFNVGQTYCHKRNAKYVSIRSAEQNRFISNLAVLKDIWLNGQQESLNSQTFKWLDGNVFNYTNWYSGAPEMIHEDYINCIYTKSDEIIK
ncbi:hypothetical protein B4U80_14536, partial [Leptotrombidium deliense]